MNVMWLMPERIGIKIWEDMFNAYIDNGKYILDIALSNYLETDYVYIYVNDMLFDTIDRRIALRAGDTLHLEYSIYVGE